MAVEQPLKIESGKITQIPTTDDITVHVLALDGGGGNDAYLQLGAGQSAAVSGASTGRVRFNVTTGKLQGSETTGSYFDLIPGAIVLVSSTGRTTYTTIALALAAASSGDVVKLGPGSFSESVTIPAGVQLVGTEDNATTIAGAASTGTRVTMGDGSKLVVVLVTMPTDAVPAVLNAGTDSSQITDVGFTGAGASGIGIRNSSSGSLVLDRVFYVSGTCATFVDVTAGTVQANDIIVFAGTLTDIVSVVGATLNFVNLQVEDAVTATDGIEVGAAGIIHGQLGRLGGSTNGLHVTSNTADIELDGFDFDSGTWDILGDGGVTSATFRISGGKLSVDKISTSGGLRSSSNWLVSFLDAKEGDEALRIEGELSVGSAGRPSESVLGEGDSYTEGMVVITTDGTATSTTDGGNLTDVSADAASASGSTFTFQGVTAGHTILFGTTREDAASVLKHWGLKLKQTTAAVEVTPLSFVIEIWDGAAWVEVGVMATHSSSFYRYANELFIRGSDDEHLRFGVDDDTTWATKAISGDTLYWSRIRIDTTITTAPVFEQSKISTSRFEANGNGTNTFHGLSRFRRTIMNTGNIFGESGGVNAWTVAVGSGGVPTGWTHKVKNSNLNGNGDAIYAQLTLPRGIDTSFPLELRAYYVPTAAGSNDVDLIMSLLMAEVEGVLEADPAGGVTPVARTLANTATLTANAGVAVSATVDSATATKVQSVDFSPYSIQSFYEGDVALLRLELDDDGVGNANIGILMIEISGVMWTHGERL